MAVIIHELEPYVIGDDWVIYGRLTDNADPPQPLDPTPATSITWKLADEALVASVFTLTFPGAGIAIGTIPDWPVPVVVITLPKASTATLAPGTYRDQLRLVLAGQTSTFWQGPLQALPQLP